ncbi:hypothetical protein RND71_020450 [Anisodus tanguticus]|uniref:BZIP domain-containing protein n=1 Tax=Anisodus tanguticus TaxID=243964 RepID=A0AAE1S104_9SOLA|nr:hypothetical protein RND71_020450 [Anisodus tanguticus]
MASFSGTTSGSSQEDLQQLMDQRKRKRMISNRESARKSRMRKQKHCDDLMAQVNQLKEENNQIVTNINTVTQLFLNVEAENSILRAQMAELNHRLQSLNEIINSMNSANSAYSYRGLEAYSYRGLEKGTIFEGSDTYAKIFLQGPSSISANYHHELDDDFLNPWNLLNVNQPIMSSSDFLMY